METFLIIMCLVMVFIIMICVFELVWAGLQEWRRFLGYDNTGNSSKHRD